MFIRFIIFIMFILLIMLIIFIMFIMFIMFITFILFILFLFPTISSSVILCHLLLSSFILFSSFFILFCNFSSSFILFHTLSSSFIIFNPLYFQLQTLADMSDLVCSRDISHQSVSHLETGWHQGHGFTFQAKAMAKRKYPGFNQYFSVLSSASDLESRPRLALLG